MLTDKLYKSIILEWLNAYHKDCQLKSSYDDFGYGKSAAIDAIIDEIESGTFDVINKTKKVKVIETNLSMANGFIVDHQSRVIEVDSWSSFINEVGNADCVRRTACIGSMYGNTIPMGAKVENFVYDEKTLSCDVYSYSNVHTKKLAYLIQ